MIRTGTVVVGVDGSPGSRAAIEFAVRETLRRGAWLRVIAVAQPPEYWTAAYGSFALPAPENVIDEAKKAARRAVEGVVSAHPELAAVEFTVEAMTGPPGQVLVDATDGADLLMLGHRGRGAVRSALLGSVSLHCVLHATCPVTVIPAATDSAPSPVPAQS